MYAKISDTAYTNVESSSSSDGLMNVLEGFYRRPDGRFVKIREERHPSIEAPHQQIFADLESRASEWLTAHDFSNLIGYAGDEEHMPCD